ncbi:MAG: hypothetical protein JWN82_377 [Candidatus Saccharibacteria bacterium]|nr:hypothetical protein [Candidatus Saccharibacteria bacterium]
MQRLAKLFLATLLLTSSLLLLHAGPVYAAKAQTQKEANACTKKFDFNKTKKTYKDGSSDLTKATNDPCFAIQGNCLMDLADTATTYKAKCTSKPGTNVEAHAEAVAESQAAAEGATSGTGSGDPAIDFASSNCGKSACNIISNYVNPFIKLLTVLVGLAVVIGIIIGSIQVMTSAGDPQKAANGKNHIRNALIAIVAYILLFGMLSWLIPGGIL